MSRRYLPMDSSRMCSGDRNCFVLGGREGQLFLRVIPLLCHSVLEDF